MWTVIDEEGEASRHLVRRWPRLVLREESTDRSVLYPSSPPDDRRLWPISCGEVRFGGEKSTMVPKINRRACLLHLFPPHALTQSHLRSARSCEGSAMRRQRGSRSQHGRRRARWRRHEMARPHRPHPAPGLDMFPGSGVVGAGSRLVLAA